VREAAAVADPAVVHQAHVEGAGHRAGLLAGDAVEGLRGKTREKF
jgi:hypothetical protein